MGSLFLTFFSSFRVPKGQKTPIIPLEAIQTFLFHPKEPRKKSVHRRLTLAFLPTPQGRGPEGQKPNFARSDGGTRKMEALSELSPSLPPFLHLSFSTGASPFSDPSTEDQRHSKLKNGPSSIYSQSSG